MPLASEANVETKHSESSTPTNPLVSFRERLQLTPLELADVAGVSVVIIKLQENGIPHHLHPRFLRTFPDCVELIPEYQRFRTSVRRTNWPNGTKVIPTSGPEFSDFLRSSGMAINVFSEKACLPATDISYAMHHWRIPSTVVRFFEEVNCSD